VGVLIIALMMASLLGSCGSMITTAVDAFLQTTWLSEDVDINEADLYYTKLEAELQRKVHRIASEHPGYDEYRYDLDEVGHDPVGLISYLSAEAENGIFVYDSALKDKLEEVFDQQYDLDIQTLREATTTTRTVRVGESIGRVVTSAYCNCPICCGRWSGGPTASGVYPTSNHTLAVDIYDPIVPMGTKIIMNGRLYKVEDTGYLNRYGVNFDIYMDSHTTAQNWGHKSFEAYLYDANGASEVTVRETSTKKICLVKLRKKSFDAIAHRNLDLIREEQYKLYCESCGNRQFLTMPSATDWKEHVAGLYGYRWSSSNDISRHNGLDLSLPSGSAALAVMEGTVKRVGHNNELGNFVTIQKESYTVTYGHLRSVSVRQGQSVAVGDTIGRVGSTGNVSEPTLHMEFTYNGDLYNPYFYLQNRRVSQENA
jgi:3D (Asp-Asp-Asp) domain-containing protein